MSLHSFLGFLLLLAAACSAAELPSEGGVVGVEEQKVIFKDGMGGIPGEEEEHFTREDISCSFMLMGMFFFTMVIFYLVNYPDDDIKRYSWSIINTTISIFCAVLIFSAADEVLLTFVLNPVLGEFPRGWRQVGHVVVEYFLFVCWLLAAEVMIACFARALCAGDRPEGQKQWVIHDTLRGDHGNPVVVLMGGNYVVKAQPYYPPLEVVRSNAQSMFQGAQNMAYVPPPASNGAARPVVPCVRLGAMMEAALKEKGTTVDESFKTTLEGVVKTFQEEGVYVFLDMHQDACATTNGGEGYPWWATADFQQRAGCKLEQCCCCCCFSRWCCECWPDSCRTPYITTPVYPLQPFFCLCNCAARLCNLDIVTYDQDPVPWEPYSVGSEGNPAWMNVGNASMRRNNADSQWSRLLTTAQVQNTARRIYASKHNDADRAIFFDPFVSLVKYLCSVWEKYDNVIAVELMNEPPIAGLPDICYVLTVWSKILAFQADVMAELEKDATVPKSPIAIANFTSTVEGESWFIKLLTCCPCSGTPREAKKIFDSFAQQNRLILSFHFYSPPATGSFEEVIQLAKKNAIKLGGIPIFLSEYFENGAQLMADKLAVAVNQGANAVTYWQYVDRDYTQQDGWYIYTEEVQALGGVVSNAGIINTPGWDVYKTTVADGTFWGAYITGAGGGRQNVLELVPATNVSASLPVPWPKNYTSLHHGLKCDPESSDCAKDAKEAKDL